jgi:hypothetical protein
MKRLTCAALFVFVATSFASAQDKIKDSPYYPLQVGDSWTYKAGDRKYTLKVVKIEKVGGESAARVEMSDDGKTLTSELVSVREDGVYRYSFGDKKPDKPVCFFKLPPKKGVAWDVDVKAGGETLKGSFKLDEAKGVKVPAGTFDTFTSSSDDLDAAGLKINCTFYFAEKVGLVKQVIKVNNQEITVELEKFEPAKK